MKNITIQLGTLTCPSCLQKIQQAVGQQNGVADVKVLFNASKVKAKFDSELLEPDQLKNVIEKLGYEVKTMQVKEA